MEPIVSIIIPTYGNNTNPARAISSVLKQNYIHVEVIVVDDNGKGSVQQIRNEEVISKIKDRRVKYVIHEKNRGGSAARNTGVNVSSGDYLCFLDDDDEFTDPEKISKQISESMALDDSWAGTYSSCDIFEGDKPYDKVQPTKSGMLLYDYLVGNVRIETACPIIRKFCFNAVGGFDPSFKRHQDWEFFSRILDRYKLKAVPEATYSRYIKMDVSRKPSSVRLEYMDKFANAMRNQITSLDTRTLEKALKHKYLQVVFVMFREMKFVQAIEVMRKNHYSITDYLMTVWHMGQYVWKKVANGKKAAQ